MRCLDPSYSLLSLNSFFLVMMICHNITTNSFFFVLHKLFTHFLLFFEEETTTLFTLCFIGRPVILPSSKAAWRSARLTATTVSSRLPWNYSRLKIEYQSSLYSVSIFHLLNIEKVKLSFSWTSVRLVFFIRSLEELLFYTYYYKY